MLHMAMISDVSACSISLKDSFVCCPAVHDRKSISVQSRSTMRKIGDASSALLLLVAVVLAGWGKLAL